jgi:hypothetical protein
VHLRILYLYFRCAVAASGVMFLIAASRSIAAPHIQWITQSGTSAYEQAYGVSPDSLGNVFVAGFTGNLLGQDLPTRPDMLIAKYDVSGNEIWNRSYDSGTQDLATDISADGLGNAYFTGHTLGDFAGPNVGDYDVILGKIDSAGSLLWKRQLGSTDRDISASVSADPLGGVYITGQTFGNLAGPANGGWNAYLIKYDANGNQLWSTQFPGFGEGVSADGLGHVYTAGWGGQSVYGGADGFVTKYDASGNLLWTRQLGSSADDIVDSIATNSVGDVWVSGVTYGNLAATNQGERDVFVAKYNSSGDLLWVRQFGTPTFDLEGGLTVDEFGNAYVIDNTYGDLVAPNKGPRDVVIGKFDPAGNMSWIYQFGTTSSDDALGIASDRHGSVYLAGQTFGKLGSANFGGLDLYVMKITVPEPPGAAMLLLGCAALLLSGQRKKLHS